MSDKSQSVLKAAWLIALVTIVSKFVGFLRDITIANCYGASVVSDAYFYAYQLPALAIILLGGVGGPFHSAPLPRHKVSCCTHSPHAPCWYGRR